MAEDARSAGAPAPAVPDGPWLLVVGMHRSGTSALTGALGALGFSVPAPADLVEGDEGNPEHWESTALTLLDDRLLRSLGGSWEAPPPLAPGWEQAFTAPAAADPRAALRTAFGSSGGPVVWKDPRLCLLLPYWRRVLPPPLAAVLIWRSPLSVATSLHRRDGLHPATGVALWERYNRSALADLHDLAVYVVRYEALVADPGSTLTDLSGWLASLPQFADAAGRWSPGAAVSTIATQANAAQEKRSPVDHDRLLLAPHVALMGILTSLSGPQWPFKAADLGEESEWTTGLLSAQLDSRTREVRALQTQLRSLRASTSWRLTRPLRLLGSLGRRGAQP